MEGARDSERAYYAADGLGGQTSGMLFLGIQPSSQRAGPYLTI